MRRDPAQPTTPGPTTPGATTPRPPRARLTFRRLLAALVLVLAVPVAIAAAALSSDQSEAQPAAATVQYEVLQQVPDSLASTQLARSRAASELAEKLTTPTIVSAADTGQADGLDTLVLPARSTAYTLAELHELVPAAFSSVAGADGAVLVTVNIEVAEGATLVIDGQTPNVRLASSATGFATVISRGTVTVSGSADQRTTVSSWDTSTGAADAEVSDGRSFVLQIGGRMDVDHGEFSYLGFGTGTSSGVAWRGASAESSSGTQWVKTGGTVTNSVFSHNHFGAYTHQAEGMTWKGNTFSDNEEYGFDPHDYSDNFTVTGNTARNNGKHGFIFSFGCDGNTLTGNYAYDNAGHGYMIDDGRSATTEAGESRIEGSDNNTVSGNVAFDNGGSGVEIEGGTGNVVSGNTVRGNDIGIRVKDDAAASVTDNTVADNTHYGINVLDSAGAAQVPVSGNTISGSWAAINLESEQSATLSNNNSTDVTTALVVAGVASHDTSWFERISTFLRWNPMLILWALVLGVPSLVGAARILGVPLRAGRHRALPS